MKGWFPLLYRKEGYSSRGKGRPGRRFDSKKRCGMTPKKRSPFSRERKKRVTDSLGEEPRCNPTARLHKPGNRHDGFPVNAVGRSTKKNSCGHLFLLRPVKTLSGYPENTPPPPQPHQTTHPPLFGGGGSFPKKIPLNGVLPWET